MKLIIITAISTFENEIRKILKSAEIDTYSVVDVSGFRDNTLDAVSTNWFATEMNKSKSILFYVFVKEEKAAHVFKNVNVFNETLESDSRIHIAKLNIEQFNS